jgi:hypothetical protein
MVNTYNLSNQQYPGIAMDPYGNFVITWQSNGQDGNGYGIYAQQYDSMGNITISEFKVNTYTADNQDEPAIAMDSRGYYVIAWESFAQDGSNWGIYSKRYNNIPQCSISDIQISGITDTSATITWKSNIPSDSRVDYGFSKAYGFTSQDLFKETSHIIDLTGLEPGRVYHFRVVSFNYTKNYNVSEDFTFTTMFSIDLLPGWNMISIPMNLTDSNLSTVFTDISGDYDALQWYDANDPDDPWKHNHTSKPVHLNDLTHFDKYMALWIHITNPLGTTFYIGGTAPEIGYVNQITLYNGWNFVGYPSLIERAPGSSGLPLEVDMVQWYNASSGLWESWDPGISPDTLDSLKPGQGLWVHYTGVSDVWLLEYAN